MLISQYDESHFKKVQRREFVRVDCHLDVRVNNVSEETDALETVTKDISGGGVALYFPENIKLNEEDQFRLAIHIQASNNQDQVVFTNAEIIRISSLDHDDKKVVSFEYQDISDRDRQRIIQFCFETQLKNHKYKRRQNI